MSTITGNVDVNKIKEVITEVERRKASRRDYLVTDNLIGLDAKGQIGITSLKQFQVGEKFFTEWKDAEAEAETSCNKIVVLDQAAVQPATRTAFTQILERAGVPCEHSVPVRFADALLRHGCGEQLSTLVNGLMAKSPNKALVRCLDGRVRAVLSDKYRVLDNHDVFFAAAETLQAAQAKLWTARLTDDKFEILAVSEQVHGEVVRQMDAAQGKYHHVVLNEDKDDPLRGHGGGRPMTELHNAMVKITNSETGNGGLSVWIGMLNRVCNNTVFVGKAVSVIHLGKRNDNEGLVNYGADTLASESQTIWLKLRDACRTAFDQKTITLWCEKMSGLTAVKIDKPEATIAHIVGEYSLSEERKNLILRSFLLAGDNSAYGIVQAVTDQVKQASDDEEASRLEQIGGELIEAGGKALAAMAA